MGGSCSCLSQDQRDQNQSYMDSTRNNSRMSKNLESQMKPQPHPTKSKELVGGINSMSNQSLNSTNLGSNDNGYEMGGSLSYGNNTYQNKLADYVKKGDDVHANDTNQNKSNQNYSAQGYNSRSSVKKDLEIQIPQDEYQGQIKNEEYEDDQSEIQRIVTPSGQSDDTEMNRMGDNQSMYSHDTELRRIDNASQSDRSGTIINRIPQGSTRSQFTDTSMVRVVEDDEDDQESNYLRKLESNNQGKDHSRQYAQSINQKVFPQTTTMKDNSNKFGGKQRKLTNEDSDGIKVDDGMDFNNGQSDIGSQFDQLRDANGSMESYERGSSYFKKGDLNSKLNKIANQQNNNDDQYYNQNYMDGKDSMQSEMNNHPAVLNKKVNYEDLDSNYQSQRNTLKVDSYLNTEALDEDGDNSQYSKNRNIKGNVNNKYNRSDSRDSY
ncbi:UNKNOWN [Stylonychia lemnae]|uniref:Uncharacterized protein n=1 Tax=Stylonychia lemnae TaxID=5949 RepID=A0A077ZVB3_STYLE|nr:UNKNOWN [Stylonychia lemnae]|eukprot:CDW73804.1 UNKNOWN [Stylonychia lemnae]